MLLHLLQYESQVRLLGQHSIAETFFHTLKVELIHGKTYNTRQEAKTAIFEYIEGFYNRQRRHSYLGYLSPEDFEKKNAA